MNFLDMIIYYGKKNFISRRKIRVALREVNIMKSKGFSNQKIFLLIPEWGKKIV